jgi:uncharacterized protein RhaS with RHS repeats
MYGHQYSARWLNRDPIAEAGGLNLYTYVENDPLDKTDPTGECPSCLIGALVEVGFEAYTGELNNAFSQAFEGNFGALAVSGAKIGVAAISGGVSTVAAAKAVGIAAKAAEAIGASTAATTAAKVAAVAGTQAASGAGTQAANNAVEGKPIGDNVGTAAAVGAVAGTAAKYGGDAIAAKAGDALEGLGGAAGANLKNGVNAVTKIATGEAKKEVSCTAKSGSAC